MDFPDFVSMRPLAGAAFQCWAARGVRRHPGPTSGMAMPARNGRFSRGTSVRVLRDCGSCAVGGSPFSAIIPKASFGPLTPQSSTVVAHHERGTGQSPGVDIGACRVPRWSLGLRAGWPRRDSPGFRGSRRLTPLSRSELLSGCSGTSSARGYVSRRAS